MHTTQSESELNVLEEVNKMIEPTDDERDQTGIPSAQ